ncbi:radical SAM family heme chaperone HemW [bacterium]|nr:radical SAM family heme chaperone HemW [bacterium]
MNGLYLHIPFCVKKCSYCDFYSVPYTRPLAERFIGALETEIGLRSHFFPDGHGSVSTLFFGGGTPSLLAPGTIASILDSIRDGFSVDGGAEITLETNPGTLTPGKAEALLAAGVTRFSIGVQSFERDELVLLDRIHTAEEAEAAVKAVRDAGCRNIGIDLIFGLPGQTAARWRNTLEKALLLEPDHISAYALTWDSGTVLGRAILGGTRPAPREERVADMFMAADTILGAAGYRHYEVSNYAKPGHVCAHNLLYWQGGQYLGLGPSAHSFSGNRRSWNISDVSRYIDVLSQHQLPMEGGETLAEEERRLERLALALRTDTGAGLDLIPASSPVLERLSAENLGSLRNGRFVLSAAGFLLADEIALLLSEEDKKSRTG